MGEKERFQTDCKMGLTDEQVKSRIDAGLTNNFNPNTTKSYRQIFKDNLFTFFNVLNLVFTVLIIMTGYIKELVFLLVVVGNLIIGIAQEIVTKKTLDKLSVIVAAKVDVVRNGKEYRINVADLVLDDIMQMKPGDQVCADGIILEGRCV